MKAVVAGLIVAGGIGVTAITVPAIPTVILFSPLVIPIAILHNEYRKSPKPKSTTTMPNDPEQAIDNSAQIDNTGQISY